MTLVGQYLDAVWATVKRDAGDFRQLPVSLRRPDDGDAVAMTMFYSSPKLVRPGVVGPEGRYLAYVEVGIVSLSVLTAALNTCQLVRAELLDRDVRADGDLASRPGR